MARLWLSVRLLVGSAPLRGLLFLSFESLSRHREERKRTHHGAAATEKEARRNGGTDEERRSVKLT